MVSGAELSELFSRVEKLEKDLAAEREARRAADANAVTLEKRLREVESWQDRKGDDLALMLDDWCTLELEKRLERAISSKVSGIQRDLRELQSDMHTRTDLLQGTVLSALDTMHGKVSGKKEFDTIMTSLGR
jgi:chromosome segregation ATPase